MYSEAGASGYLSKRAKAAKLASDLMLVYSRAVAVGLCDLA